MLAPRSSQYFFVIRKAKFGRQHVLQIRTDFLTAMTMKIAIFWDETPCSLIGMYRHCRRACFLLRVFPSTLMMEVACYSEASVHVYQATRCHIVEDSSLIVQTFLRFFGLVCTFPLNAKQVGANGDFMICTWLVLASNLVRDIHHHERRFVVPDVSGWHLQLTTTSSFHVSFNLSLISKYCYSV